MEETANKTETAVVSAPEENYDIEEISLRDYMAAQALGGVLELMEDEAEEEDDFHTFAFNAARRAYALADAMMIVRDYEFSDEDEEEEEGEEEGEEEASDQETSEEDTEE